MQAEREGTFGQHLPAKNRTRAWSPIATSRSRPTDATRSQTGRDRDTHPREERGA